VLADIEVSNAKTEMCDCKKKQFGITKTGYNYKKNEVMSLNRLNYKAPEKSLATKELVRCIP
jgi:hypothetical protein